MATRGKHIRVFVYGRYHEFFKDDHPEVGEVVEQPSGALSLFDLYGGHITTYSPCGYMRWEDVHDANI